MTEGGPAGRGPSEADLTAAIHEASRSLGVPYEAPGEPESATGRSLRRGPILIGVLVVGLVTALALRGPGLRSQPTDLVEADLRWAVARVVEHVERERLLRGQFPPASDVQVLLGEALTYSLQEGSYRVVGRRDGVSVEYDGTLPLDEWRALVLYPPGTASR